MNTPRKLSRVLITFGLTALLAGGLGLVAGCSDDDDVPTTEDNCTDGADNDQDGDTDCDDSDCATNEACFEYDCADGVDNDNDGLTDCDDDNCATSADCMEQNCSDGIDDEGDGLTDCEDPDCADDPACQEVCDDGEDNDLDGLTDCEDVDDCLTAANCQEYLNFTILETSDLHSHAGGFGNQFDYSPLSTGDDSTTSGYARLAAVIGGIKMTQAAAGIPTVLLDGGDFTMGTVYDMSIAADPIQMAFFEALGYDAITLGNHEFDWSPAGTAMLISNAMNGALGFTVPIVTSNMTLAATDTRDDGLEALKTAGAIVDDLVLTLPNGLVVGILANMGEISEGDAPTAKPVTFDHDLDNWQSRVDDMITNNSPDVVVLLSHGGLAGDGTYDDEVLAASVTGIDILASGHSHYYTDDVMMIENGAHTTYLIQPGEYGEYVAQLDVQYNTTQSFIESVNYTGHMIDDTVTGDPTTQAMVEAYTAGIDAQLLQALPVASGSPVASVNFDLEVTLYSEHNLGNFCADALRTIATGALAYSADNTPASVAVVPNGVIRDPLRAGNLDLVTFADIYNVLPLGMTPDPANQNAPGWPLISVYVTATELREIAEVAITGSAMANTNDIYLNFSGMRYNADIGGPFFANVRQVYLCGNTLPPGVGGDGDIFSATCNDLVVDLDDAGWTDDGTLYRLVVDLYTALSLGKAAALGFSIAPKKSDGTLVDLADIADLLSLRVDADPMTAGIQEVKGWQALLMFVTDPQILAGNIPAAVYDAGGIGMGRVTEL